MNFDITYCASRNCENECGRKLPKDFLETSHLQERVSYAYSCEENELNGYQFPDTTKMAQDEIE